MLGLSGLAGCLGARGSEEPSSTPTPPVTTGGVFERVAVEGTTLVVDLAEDTDVDTVNVIAPNGELYRRLAVAVGVTRLATRIVIPYTPGIYQFVAVKQSTTVGQTSLLVEPATRVSKVELAMDTPEGIPTGLSYADAQVRVELLNTGAGPESVTALRLKGDVPNPTWRYPEEPPTSEIFDESDGFGDSERVLIEAGTNKAVYSTGMPFLQTGRGTNCSGEPQQGTFIMEIDSEITGKTLRTEIPIRWQLSEDGEECSFEIGEAVDA
jgi:hypothetical protein